jgi:hypothetical protein
MELHLRHLVPIGVELDPALLHEYAAIVFVRIKREAGEIAFHGCLLS